MTFISPDNSFALWVIMLLLAALTFKVEKMRLGQKLSGPIIMTASLSNLGIIPWSSFVK